MASEDSRVCICQHRRDEHDQERCDVRCNLCDCESFRLCAHQPQTQPKKHTKGHGPSPGKGMTGSAVPLSNKKGRK